MRKLQVERLDNEYYDKYRLDIPKTETSTYLIPSIPEAVRNNKDTFGEVYDPIERQVVKGGIPMLWERDLGKS